MDNKNDNIITDDSPSSASDEEIEDEDDADAYEISSATEGSEAATITTKQPLNKTGANVKKSKINSVTETDSNHQQSAGAVSSKKRKRKRHFYNAIRQQIEFYFSDSNLSKDRFLQKVISKSSDSSK